MLNKNILPLRVIFWVVQVILFTAPYSCFAQSSYKEIEVYRSLCDKNALDSSYYKALTKYAAVTAPVVFSALQQRLATIVAMPASINTAVIQKREALEALAQEAAVKQEIATELSALSEAFTMAFWSEPKNYSKAFVLAVHLENRLSGVNDQQFAGRREAYVKLGEAYYIFKDFATSIKLLENVIHHTPTSLRDISHLEALRISGICYANMPEMMPKSDSCFMAMMLCDDTVLNRPVYNALALSNLGCNAMMQGDFDRALALNLEVLSQLKQQKDYGHVAGMYSCQGFCYLGKGDYHSLSMVIDSISHYAHKDYYNRNKRLKQAYTLNGKYHSAVGDAQRAQLYNDSLAAIYKAEESLYTSQFISDARHEVNAHKIRVQREQVERQRSLILSVLIILGIISIGMIIIVQLYRKRSAAYRALARKAEEWALDSIDQIAEPLEQPATESCTKLKEQPTEEDIQIMSLVEQRVVAQYAYRDKNLTMDELADQLGVRRHLLSRAVNHVTAGNFNHYINSYRIREAVRIISQNGRDELHINDVYERVGFTNRTTFYRVFKQFTGLSPLEFQKSQESNEKKITAQ